MKSDTLIRIFSLAFIICVFLLPRLVAADFQVDEDEHWYFHTGEGYSVTEYPDMESGTMQKVWSRCTLDEFNPFCQEKVYLFTKNEIMHFVNEARKIFEERLNSHTSNLALSSTVLVITSKAAYSGFVAPEPTMISKIIAGASALAAGVAGVMVAWEGYEIKQVLDQVARIDHFFSEQSRYVQKCHHVRKDFLERAKELGITIVFAKYGSRLIDGEQFISGLKRERELAAETIAYAEENGITMGRAYNEYFLPRCGQMTYLQPTPLDQMLKGEGVVIPQDVIVKSMEVADEIGFTVGSPFEFTGFKEHHLTRQNGKLGIFDFFEKMQADNGWITDIGTQEEQKSFQRMKRDVTKIVIKRKSRFGSNKKSYLVQKEAGKTILILYAHWSRELNTYRISWSEFLRDHYNLRFLSWNAVANN